MWIRRNFEKTQFPPEKQAKEKYSGFTECDNNAPWIEGKMASHAQCCQVASYQRT